MHENHRHSRCPAVQGSSWGRADNPFVFAYMTHSSDGTTGFIEIMSVCRLINVTVITATEVKHRLSTAFLARG